MQKIIVKYAPVLLFLIAFSCHEKDDDPQNTNVLQLSYARIGTYDLNLNNGASNNEAPVNKPLVMSFSAPLQESAVAESIYVHRKDDESSLAVQYAFLDNGKTVSLTPLQQLTSNTTYVLTITKTLKGIGNEQFSGIKVEFTTVRAQLQILSVRINDEDVTNVERPLNIPLQDVNITIAFSSPVDEATIIPANFRIVGPSTVTTRVELVNESVVKVSVDEPMQDLRRYRLIIDGNVRGLGDERFEQLAKPFYTMASDEPDFSIISDEALLTLVQQKTFNYFFDFAHPASGMARERNTSGDLVTAGGSGFGIMALIVGVERGFITRAQAIERFNKIINFLEDADRFHGAWAHWMDGTSGNVIPFSANDNGADLVETAFLVQGLLTLRQYLDESNNMEKNLIDRINTLWTSVEWNWFTKGNENVLYWHWSPDKGWAMNHKIQGHNETLITYVLAAASPTHSISAQAYHQGYARNGAMANNRTFYNMTLPLGEDYGGPLFFAHYSFLGLDPRNLSDTYADYWTQNRNHTLINRAYVIANPKRFAGYTAQSWGLTASDNPTGYSAHSPLNDLGVITPTAALSSFPYTPAESMDALKFFYYSIGDRLWGPYGFYDAYSITDGWTANSYLAIDQGPIVVMIENYRTGLLWDLFMSCPEVQEGLTKLGFSY